jgi:predicted ribosome quality control (RQC) complex YloA/Tae2 family protein
MREVFFNNIKYIIGESAKDNWNMLKLSKQDYIWFHLDNNSSPYVILCDTEKNIKKLETPKKYLEEGAKLCKENSKMRNAYKTKIIYTEIRNLTKGNNIGSVIVKRKPNIIIL